MFYATINTEEPVWFTPPEAQFTNTNTFWVQSGILLFYYYSSQDVWPQIQKPMFSHPTADDWCFTCNEGPHLGVTAAIIGPSFVLILRIISPIQFVFSVLKFPTRAVGSSRRVGCRYLGLGFGVYANGVPPHLFFCFFFLDLLFVCSLFCSCQNVPVEPRWTT